MLTVSQVSKSYGGRVLFSDASLQINPGDRIGLVGPNGAGKSTLFSLILNESSPDSGSVTLQRGATVGFLPQESAPSGDETILQLATAINPEMAEIHRLLREFPDENAPEHHDAIERFVEQDGFQLEIRARRILAGLAFKESDASRIARTMSGGWIMRAHLARLLVMEPDLLMLDEPTNHLDLESLGWFQSYLQNYRGAILTISHDRAFLNTICRGIVEISRQQLHHYTGNYDSFIAQKAAREEAYAAAYKNQQREIAHLEEFINRFRAKASKAAQAQERIKRLAKMERLAAPESPESTVKFRFPQPTPSGQRVMSLNAVTQAYGDHVVYRDLDAVIEKGQRTVLVGPNGAGKSTLLKILADIVPIQAGSRTPGHNATVGYFAQQRAEVLDPTKTVLAEALADAPGVPEQTARGILGSFLFRGDDVFKTTGILSGGEKTRLAMVKLLLNPPNFLLLDEPTTHLDISSIDALIRALSDYNGTLLFVSHDVHFIRAIATTVWHINSGIITRYAGNYDYFLEKSNQSSDRSALVAALTDHRPIDSRPAAGDPSATPAKLGMREIRQQRRMEAEQRKAEQRAKREAEQELTRVENEIATLEARQQTLASELEDPTLYANPSLAMEKNRELSGVQDTLAKLTARWEAMASLR